MINNPAFFRQDITEGRSGLPVMLALTVVNVSSGCSPVANAQIEIWQCDAEGRYSEYSQPGYNKRLHSKPQDCRLDLRAKTAARRIRETTTFTAS